MAGKPSDGGAVPIATAQRVAQELRERIVEGVYRPGIPLREAGLAASLGISRNTLRETFRLLASEGLIVQRMNRGSVVAEISADQVRDIFVVRRTLEIRAIEESVLASERALERLESTVVAAEQAAAGSDWQQFGTASLRFHQRLVGLLDSPRLDAFFESIVAQLRLAFAAGSDERAVQLPWVGRDRKVYNLVRSGRRDEAIHELRSYLDESERRTVDAIRRG